MGLTFPFIKELSKQPSPRVLVNFPGWIQILSNLCYEIQSSTKFVTSITVTVSILVQVFKTVQGGEGENSFISNVPVSDEEFELMKNEKAKVESFIEKHHQLSQVQTSSVSTVVDNRMEETACTYLLNLRVYLSSLSDKIQEVLDLKNASESSRVDVPFEPELEKLRNLKIELCDVLDKLDTELLDLVIHPDQSKREDKCEELISKKEKIIELLSDLSTRVIRKHLGGFHSLGFVDYLADIIGLRRDVVRKILENKSSFLQDHYGIEELIHLYLDGVSQDDANEETYEDQVRGLGFTENRARYLGSKIRGYSWEDRHISVLEFAHCFIEDIFKYDVLLNEDITRVLSSSSGDNGTNKKCFVNDDEQKDVSIFNKYKNAETGSRPGKHQVDSSTNEFDTKPEDGFEHWFHGTDLDAVNNMCRYGINIDKGKKKKDFSDERGFYLSDQFNKALDFTGKFTAAPTTAVLRYNIPKEFFSTHSGIELSINNKDDMKKWKEIVRHFRSGMEEGDKQLKKEIRDAKYIRGPLSHDGQWTRENRQNPNWPKPIKEPWSQLCIQKRSTAEELNKYLDSILFIQAGHGPTTQGNERAVEQF